MALMERKDELSGLGHFGFGHSILIRVSHFVLRICDIKAGTPAHPRGVRLKAPSFGLGFFTKGLLLAQSLRRGKHYPCFLEIGTFIVYDPRSPR